MEPNQKTLVSGRRVILVGLALPQQPSHVVEEHLDELAELAVSAGAEVVGRSLQNRQAPHAATFIGPGKAKSLRRAAEQSGAELLVFDDDLTPSQVANLEQKTDCVALDRSGLILEIFRAQARSREARTQVELAQLEYELPRLTKRWSHLSRQAGGIGLRGGEGETQLEADRRQLRQRIRRLKRDLGKIEKTRDVQRAGRRGIATVALAGYTNAGKSTLFNRLTHASARVEDRVFATLDSKLRRGALAPGHIVLFADTVGFIRKLPHHLVASFRGTLEEVVAADLVVHVVDRSHPAWKDQRRVGAKVLEELGIETDRILEVHNKADLLNELGGSSDGPLISAKTGEGVEGLKACIAARLESSRGGLEQPLRLDTGWSSA